VSGPHDVVAAVRSARRFQQRWKAVSLAERADILLRYHDLVLDHRHELVDLVLVETGKARKQAFEEVAHVALTARYYGHKAVELLSPQRRLGVFPGAHPGRAAVRPEGRRRGDLPVELPAEHGDGRRTARGTRR
jgi:succinate-semialdehyde dehydrogenase/glutarate-semialdehyde dehydrogenase